MSRAELRCPQRYPPGPIAALSGPSLPSRAHRCPLRPIATLPGPSLLSQAHRCSLRPIAALSGPSLPSHTKRCLPTPALPLQSRLDRLALSTMSVHTRPLSTAALHEPALQERKAATALSRHTARSWSFRCGRALVYWRMMCEKTTLSSSSTPFRVHAGSPSKSRLTDTQLGSDARAIP
jgi:hypothetical protein